MPERRPGIKYTPTVQAVRRALRGDVTAGDVVKAILQRHPQYGEGTARDVREGPWPSGATRPVAKWLEQVEELFDPELTDSLHGRLAILALCKLDSGLDKHLRGFRAALERELHEDFESLLRPEHAGVEGYRGEFLRILQNRGKVRNESARTRGFLVLIEGGPGIEPLSRLCFKQSYNDCLTARYVLPARLKMNDFTLALLRDLRAITGPQVKGGPEATTMGEFLPVPGNRRPGSRPIPLWSDRPAEFYWGLESLDEKAAPAFTLGQLCSNWRSLETGQRVVLFVEWHGIPGALPAETFGLDADLVRVLTSLPERVGIVLSGLPTTITSQLESDHSFKLALPPDRELTRGQRLLNDTPTGADRLNILGEVRALAEAIALKDMHPPLVVGIFGGWGSGKSFVMYLLEQRLQEIRCERIEAGGDFPFVGHPYLIHFDAWTYAKGNLWASLMQTTLSQLDRQLSLEQELSDSLDIDLTQSTEVWRLLGSLSDLQKERLLKTDLGTRALKIVEEFEQQASVGKLWSTLDELRAAEKENLAVREKEVAALRTEAATARQKVENEVDKDIAADARRTAWLPVVEELKGLVGAKLAENDAATFDEAIEAISFAKRFWIGLKSLSVPAVAFMVVVIAGGFFIDQLEPLFRGYAKFAGVLAAALAPIKKAAEWLDARRRDYEERCAQAMAAKSGTREGRIEEKIRDGAPESIAGRVRRLESELQDAEGAVELLRAQVGITGRSRSLAEFLKERIEKGFYERELGLLHQIQTDIEELSDTLVPWRTVGTIDSEALRKRFPRGDPRVILFIDDLDRCPPDKVVEVLEAAQLLVKTRLFVVVIAIDVRYVTRALEAQYKDVLVRSGEPSGLDYIEKIIQIPYRVRTASDSAIRNFLRSQMDFSEEADEDEAEERAPEGTRNQTNRNQVGQSGLGGKITPQVQATRTELRVLPTKVLRFEPEEHDAISHACSAVGVSPRAMKRLVNIFKLLKIIWFRQGLDKGPAPEVKKAMLSLLALSSRFPEVLRQLLTRTEAAFRAESSPGSLVLAKFLLDETQKGARTALYPPDWDRVKEALSLSEFFPQQLTFSGLEEPNLHLVNSFSFVGETDSDREATLKRGFYRMPNGPSDEVKMSPPPPPMPPPPAAAGETQRESAPRRPTSSSSRKTSRRPGAAG